MKNSFWRRQSFMTIALACAVILIGSSLMRFLYGVNADARKGMKTQTEAIRDNSVHVLKNELGYLKRLTETAAQLLKELDFETDTAIVSKLQDYANTGGIVRTLFVSQEGNTYTNYMGHVGKISENTSLDGKLLSDIHETYFSKSFFAEELGKGIFGVVVPTTIGRQKGVLVSSYDVEGFRELFESNFLEGDSHVGIVDKFGAVVIGDNEKFKPTKFGVNIFKEFYEHEIWFPDRSLEAMREDLLSENEGFVIYDYNGIRRYCAYAPVGINDWYVFAMAPEYSLKKQVAPIENRGIELAVELVAIMTALLLAVVLIRHRDQRHTRKKLEDAAMIDSLTRIYNRGAVENTIFDYLEREGAGGSHALFAMDIDGFKLINDSFGHIVGDAVLLEFANRLKSILSGENIVGRMGGDEFIALLKNCDDREAICAEADKIVKTLANEHDVDLLTISVTISIGIALYPQEGSSFIELYQHADDALYRTKQQGKNGFSFYTDS